MNFLNSLKNGQKTNTTFRVFDNGSGNPNPGNMPFWFNSKLYHSDGILITSLNNTNLDQGFWNWSQSSGLNKIIEKGQKLQHLSKGKYKMPFLFIESGFDVAPRLMLQYPSGKEQLIYQTDSFKVQFHWGKSELINYKDIDGKALKGALFYPANYIPGKKYPMVVEIYEKRSKELHNYIVPSESIDNSSHEINPTTYTSDGYFVLFPDINYRLNDPGTSAKECVVAATEKVIDKGLVDRDKIGLIGHSFGGYETCLIITQTNLFKAAIAGSAITDLPDWYLSISDSFGVNISRVEEDQHRMQTPFYGPDFRRNSPMDNIANINTPLMLWTGDKDANVDWIQSRKFQIALWRLGKKSTLVVYPGEDHVLADPTNQKDLALREKNWFDHYLKGEKAAAWMSISKPE